MANGVKYAPIKGGTLMTELKTELHVFKTKKFLAYGFMFVFIAITIFLAFRPSSNSSSLWYNNIFRVDYSRVRTENIFSNDSFRSHFPYFFSNSSGQGSNSSLHSSPANVSEFKNSTEGQAQINKGSQVSNNGTQDAKLHDKVGILKPNQSDSSPLRIPVAVNQTATTPLTQVNPISSDVKNQTKSKDLDHKDEVLKANQTSTGVTESPVKAIPPPKPTSKEKNATGSTEKVIAKEGAVKNLTSSLAKNQNNKTNLAVSAQQERDNLVKSLINCEIFNGNWVRDESYPLYKPGSCSLIDEQFNCFLNGRPDTNYDRLRWKPKGCSLPRLDGKHMLELLRGKRLVFVGDSLNRNMWESLVCILRNSVKDQKKVYEASGNIHFRAEAYYSFVFEDYKFTIEFFVTPFLVQEWEVKSKSGEKKETLRLDMLGESASNYKDADFIIFNTGHWWTHEKTALGKDYYQEGSHVYSELNVLEAFRRALTTWGRWIDANINPQKSLVFFRGYSASHFSGGQWNSGGACDHEVEPIKNETYLSEYPPKMKVLETVLKGMKTHVSYLNITRMTDYRKDGHPSMYRKQSLSEEERRSPLMYQDCSHWCLPGVPDVWNEILYAHILLHEYKKQHQQKNP